MAKGHLTKISLVALTKKAVAVVALRQGIYIPMPQGSVPDYNALWVDNGPYVFW